MKRGFLSNEEKAHITESFADGESINDIAVSLDRSPSAVKKYLQSLVEDASPEKPEAPAANEQKNKLKARPDSLVNRRQTKSGRAGSVASSQNASENVDTINARLAARTKPVSKGAYKIYKD